MASDRIDIRHVARLARLALTDDEIATYGAQLGDLDDTRRRARYARHAKRRGDRAGRSVAQRTARRRRAPETMLTHEAALRNAPQAQNGYFRVPRIIAEEG